VESGDSSALDAAASSATPASDSQTTSPDDRWTRLEKVVRGMGRDNLAIARGQQEAQNVLASIVSRLGDLDLALKGMAQTTWRAAQERLGQAQDVEKHFAGALRELEKRVRDELLWQVQRSTILAIFPALDDMVRVLEQQRQLSTAGDEDPLLEAMALVHHRFLEGLRAIGLEEIRVEIGVTRFDPALHEAVDTAGADKAAVGGPSGTIAAVRRLGYKIQDRVFRAPQVWVNP
jgi:molecular chaperone GrpE (heat shock protein)